MSYINAITSPAPAIVTYADATGNLSLQAAGTNYITISPGAAGNVVSIPTGVGGTPCFSATAGTSQTISTSTWTKIQFATKQFDTTGAFDNVTNYRFQPLVAGYYLITLAAGHGNASYNVLASIYKNGSGYQQGQGNATSATYDPVTNISCVIYFNGSTDYVEGYMITNTTTTTENCRLTGFLARAT